MLFFSWSQAISGSLAQIGSAGGLRRRRQARVASIEQLECRTLLSANNAPEIKDQTFVVQSTSLKGTLVGSVEAYDKDRDDVFFNKQQLSFRITGGNSLGAFKIDAGTGNIRVEKPNLLESFAAPQILTITVTDNGIPQLSATAGFTIYVNHPPQFKPDNFSFFYKTGNDNVVGTIRAKDADIGQTLEYSILAGNDADIFALNSATGQLTVVNPGAFQALAFPMSLSVRVRDLADYDLDNDLDPVGGNDTATVTFEKVNHAPVFDDVTINQVRTDLGLGAEVATVAANDPDPKGLNEGKLTYKLLTGGNGAFAIDPVTGVISIADKSMFDRLPNTVTLVIEAKDAGSPPMSDTAKITLNKNVTGLLLSDESRTYRVGDAPVRLDPQAVIQLQTDQADNLNFANGTLTVKFGPGSSLKTGKLSIVSEEPGTGRVSIARKSILFGNTVVGTLKRGEERSLVIHFNSETTRSIVQAIIRRIGFTAGGKAGPRQIGFEFAGISGLTNYPGQTKVVNVISRR